MTSRDVRKRAALAAAYGGIPATHLWVDEIVPPSPPTSAPRAFLQHLRNSQMGPAHIARPLRRIRRYLADEVRHINVVLGKRCTDQEALTEAAQEPQYKFFRKAADKGIGKAVAAGARALL